MTPGRLRLGVDARAFSAPAGGVRRYVSELYRAISDVDADVTIVAFGAADHRAAIPAAMEWRPVWDLPTNLGWMAASIPLAVRGARLDVYHAPAYTAPLWGMPPQVLTIHDVSYERRPDWNAYKNSRLRRFFYRRAAAAANRILTDSSFSRNEIAEAYGIPRERIDVVPLAAGDVFAPGAFDPAAAPAGVKPPYALHVGDLHVRRNVATALTAIIEARRARPDCASLALVCAGVDRGLSSSLVALADEARDPGSLVLLGPVTESALLNLYRGASLLVYPSRYEGFGLPVVEAMRVGTPVVAARCASIPEIAGDSCLLLDPLDVAGWTRTIIDVVVHPTYAQQLADAGRKRAATFSWRRTAIETLTVFRACARSNARLS